MQSILHTSLLLILRKTNEVGHIKSHALDNHGSCHFSSCSRPFGHSTPYPHGHCSSHPCRTTVALGSSEQSRIQHKTSWHHFFFFTDWHAVEGPSLSGCTEMRKSTLCEDPHYLTLALSFMSSGQNINLYQPRQATVRFPKLIPCGCSGVNVFFWSQIHFEVGFLDFEYKC